VVGLYLGNLPFVMINDPKVAKEALSQDELIGRPRDPLALEIRSYNGLFYGILLADGEIWEQQRKFTYK